MAAACAFGFLGVALGAFGAHGMAQVWAAAEDGDKREMWWQTASIYHLVHALALGLLAAFCPRLAGALPHVAGAAFCLGILAFSGSLYLMSAGAPRWFGAVAPLGGLALLVGWATLLVASFRSG